MPKAASFEFVPEKAGAAADVLLVPLLSKPQPPLQLVAPVDAQCADAVSELIAVKALGAEAGQLAHTTRSGAYRRVLAVSLGDAEKITPHAIRLAGAAAARWIAQEKVASAALWLDGLAGTSVARAAGEWVTGMLLGGYRFLEYRTPADAAPKKVRVQVRSAEAGTVRRVMPELREAAEVAHAINYARRLAHLPPNVMHPAKVADEARALASATGLKFTLVEAAQAKRLGMGGLLAVGGGAAHPPCLVQLDYRPLPRSRRRVVLVGKAITFDTGGYSIKPSAGLEAMKFDKCGGMTVLGILRAVAALKLPCNVTGIIAVAENAISEQAYRPADIIKTMSGKTVEVISTDAEGRLVLADALWYAQEKLKPTEIIDLATLTGGVNVALGKAAAGLMSNDDELAGVLGECGRATHERLWRLPLWDDYRELVKGTDSDLKNASGKRDAHSIVGGMFLKEFIRAGTAWAHLDIAAVATTEESNTPTGKGATGFGIQLLVEYFRRLGSS